MISLVALALLGQITLKEEGVNLGVVNSINCSGSGIYCARTGTSGTVVVLGQLGDAGSGGAATTVTVDGGYLAVTNFPATQAVTGTFFQATQPVSLASVPTHGVTGTFWQATQPVSGTFFQATQPVSLASAPTTPVTGTFWQATQPVSMASAPTTPVTGTFWQATQPISAASLPTHGVTMAASSITGGNPCQNPTATLLGVSVATSGTASVQLVALSGSTKIYVCSLNVTGVSGTTPKISITYGTGSACATGTKTLVGPVTTTANINLYLGPMFAVTPAGQALCYVQTGTTPISNLNLTYVQQ